MTRQVNDVGGDGWRNRCLRTGSTNSTLDLRSRGHTKCTMLQELTGRDDEL